MELSEEEKKRIFEEEQRRQAEEKYREQVRKDLVGGGPGTQAVRAAPHSKSGNRVVLKILLIVLVIVAGVLIIGNVLNSVNQSPGSGASSPSTVLRPFHATLFTGQFVVGRAQYFYKTFTVDHTQMVNPRVVGKFRATGGMGNDIQVVLAEKGELENWINGHQAHVLYSSQKITNSSIDVAITTPGTYCLAFSNTFSLLSTKTVAAEIELQYLIR